MKYHAKDGVCYIEIGADEAALVFADGKFTSLVGPEIINSRIHSAFRGIGLKLSTEEGFAGSMIEAYHKFVENPEEAKAQGTEITGGDVPNDEEDETDNDNSMKRRMN